MFSKFAIENTKLVDLSFISGAKYEDIKSKNNYNLEHNLQSNASLKPDILLSFPDNRDMSNFTILDVIKFYLVCFSQSNRSSIQ
jgi:hypothetical protein